MLKNMSLDSKAGTNTNPAVKPIRIVVLGPCGVGKTSIIQTLKTNLKKGMGLKTRTSSMTTSSYVPTEDPYPHKVKIGGHDMEILDTAGSSSFPLMPSFSIRTGDSFVLVFSVDDMSSFEKIAAIKREIQDIHGNTVPVMVVGNKADTDVRQVPMELADCMVSIDWELEYNEISANDGKAVCRLFKKLAKSKSLETKPSHVPKRRHSFPRNVFLRTLFRPGSGRK